MIISHKYKFIFIKTRKTAGTSLEVFFSNICGDQDVVTPIYPKENQHFPRNHERFFNHMSAKKVKSIVGENTWNSYYKFCVERNPWDKVVSQFFWSGSKLDFNSFVANSELPVDNSLYLNSGGFLMVDRVLKYEDLDSDLGDVMKKMKIEYRGLNFKAKSGFRKDSSYQKMYDETSREIVKRKFKKEINLFGYQF